MTPIAGYAAACKLTTSRCLTSVLLTVRRSQTDTGNAANVGCEGRKFKGVTQEGVRVHAAIKLHACYQENQTASK
ncbi:hypothetical protein NTGBS_850004 [Candidatus Nitrotoga sp. BS]|nr:hypothetical protein NTGBS_850004 [Candidatus Nitrotoga sp. BS]